mgnify:CR=1 FL=1
MNEMTGRKFRANLRTILFALAMQGFSACGSGGGDGFTPPPPPPPPGGADIATQRVFTQLLAFNQPLAMIQRPNNDLRWYVVQRGGVIYTFPNDANVMPANVTVFANLTTIVNSAANEAGLLGVAFHPNFAANGEVYVSYTGTAGGGGLESRVSRFVSQDGGLTLSVGSEQVLLSLLQPATNHNGGQIVFGPDDGFLYIGFGDGGGSGDPNENAQNTTNLFGAILRINVDVGAPYSIPAGASGNPFAGNPLCTQGVGAVACPEIFAWGFRNPWRWSFDSLNGDLWVGDVGQGNWEEIDRVELGLNYGWNDREGAHCFDPPNGCSTAFEDPITEYSHALGNSVTGGYVYRGMTIPDLPGTYVFGDFGTGRIFGVAANSAKGVVADELLDSAHNISSFAEDLDGELYVLDYGNGFIYQIIEAP